MAIIILLVLFLSILPLFHLLARRTTSSSKKLPPGSMGLPIIGHSLGLIRAWRSNTVDKWLDRRIDNYGPVSKLSLCGAQTFFVTGPGANKFVFTNEALANEQPQSFTRLLGNRNILQLTGDDHKRVRGAVAQFLRPEVLKGYVAKMDGEVRHHLKLNWIDRKTVTVLPLMKKLTFDIISSLLFGIERGTLRAELVNHFSDLLEGLFSVPVNLPFTQFNKSLRASRRVRKLITGLMVEKKAAAKNGKARNCDDLIAYLISLDGGDKASRLTEEEIIDNAIIVMVAGHETSSVLLTFMVRRLANDPEIYARVAQEQEEIARSKVHGEPLKWDDLVKMTYTWRVAMETLRMNPPVFGNFRKALKDVEFGGYLIPKGWQVFWAAHNTQMDADIFTVPEKFDPARFENPSSIPPYSFVAFGAGTRICPGNEFAKIEVLLTMHYLTTLFKWKLCSKNDVFCRDPMASPYKGLPIELEPKGNTV